MVAITLAIIAMLSGEDDVTRDWQRSQAEEDAGTGSECDTGGGGDKTIEGVPSVSRDETRGNETKDDREVWWKALDFANGRYLYRQYNKLKRWISPSGDTHEKKL